LAFVDLHMPVMDGLEAAELLSEQSIPVVLVSGHPDAREIVLENEPLVALISKPALLDEIQAAIDLAIRY
jgi:CheY-like chemotaxis protein